MSSLFLEFVQPIYFLVGGMFILFAFIVVYQDRRIRKLEHTIGSNQKRHEISHHIRVMLESRLELTRFELLEVNRPLTTEELINRDEEQKVIEGRKVIISKINEQLKTLPG